MLSLIVVLLSEACVKVTRKDCRPGMVLQEPFGFRVDEVASLLVSGWVVDANKEGLLGRGCGWDSNGQEVSLEVGVCVHFAGCIGPCNVGMHGDCDTCGWVGAG